MLDRLRMEVAVTQAQGRDLETKREVAEREALRHEGARDGLKLASKRVAELMEIVDKEFKETEKIGGMTVEELNGEPLKMMGVVKRYLQRAFGCVDNLATTAEIAMISTNGKIKGLSDAIGQLKKSYDTAIERMKIIEQGLADGSFTVEDGELVRHTPQDREHPRMVGEHPGLTLKAQRQAEEAEAAVDKGNGVKKKTSRRKKAKAEAPDAENS